MSLLPLVGSDTQVPLLDGTTTTYANLDVAASAPALRSVADRVAEVLPWYASVHRGAGYLSQVSTVLYEESRATVGAYVGAREDDVTVITRNTTDAVNLLAGCVPGRVLVLDIEHHANLLPWHRVEAGVTERQRGNHEDRSRPRPYSGACATDAGVTAVAGRETLAGTIDALAGELARGGYALVAITGASNVTGEALPVAEIVTLAHAHGARVFVDGAQLLAHRHFSLAATGADYVAFSGHKLYAPYGAGALVGRRDWLDVGTPYLAGGGAVDDASHDSGSERSGPAIVETTWQAAPARHEGGSPNVVGAAALAAACTALGDLEAAELDRHEATLRGHLVAGLSALDGVDVLRLWPDSDEPVGVATFTVDGIEPGRVAAYLSAEHGLGVRDGRFCAQPLLKRLGLTGGAVRASIGIGTSVGDVDRLLAGVRSLLAGDVRGDYVLVDGAWTLAEDPRPLVGPVGLTRLADTAGSCGAAV
ncbi:aminotransferase class V-fold PLP-dependent enzyme [Nocardioides sp.]|uniref:aminotransferase class V-fold PLP-dependent enzyme n=1 Tax=Nocardioides sp. TaxID=35761 RepID=UPI00198F3818|nr:aminotransferase class V-fold PLP-dependent enzyme [Nocardioides sp.]MBC7279009.1 aminotransferase class V-fold PLP-dependent enzyme [Nocardioides sp.]